MEAGAVRGRPLPRGSPLLVTIRGCINLGKNLRAKADEARKTYDRIQGLSDRTSVPLSASPPPGIPAAATDRWSHLTAAERLSANAAAYRRFSDLLALLPSVVGPSSSRPGLRRAALALRTDCQSFLALIERLRAELGLDDRRAPSPAPLDVPGGWEGKVWGHKLLRELANWALRSVRDFHKLRGLVSRGSRLGHEIR